MDSTLILQLFLMGLVVVIIYYIVKLYRKIIQYLDKKLNEK